MLVDIVIPYYVSGQGMELKYCLRSIEKYLTGVGHVVIVGEVPFWAQNVVNIPVRDEPRRMAYRERNIFQKIEAACRVQGITDNFLFMNDDHFLLAEYEAEQFPYYWYHTLKNVFVSKQGNPYAETVRHTIDILGESAAYYDIHCPIVYNKKKFQKLANLYWDIEYGYCIKSLYAHLNYLPPEVTPIMEDRKISRPVSYNEAVNYVDGRKWFSTGDKAVNPDLERFLRDLYPEKSKYEI